MTPARAAALRQQRIDELCAGALRALAGTPDLHFRGRRLHRGRQALPRFAPHLHPAPDDPFDSFRGAADGLALRLLHSDHALHRRLRPQAAAAQLLFDLLEQLRVESLVPRGMVGVARNLRRRHEAWSLAFHRARLTETAAGILLFTLIQVARSRLTGEPVVEATEDLIEATRAAVVPLIGHDLAALRRHRGEQAAFARHARAIAERMAAMLDEAGAGGALGGARDGADDDAAQAALGLRLDLDAEAELDAAAAATGRSRTLDDAEGGYRVFTRAYDREAAAATLVRADWLRAQRAELDELVARLGLNLARLVRELLAVFAVPALDGWDGAQEEGRVDGRRLAQLIASPAERRLFRADRVLPRADAAVGFLVDCSGSMKVHAPALAVMLDLLVRALEQAGVASELLGFTTGAWHGGRARRDWLAAGRPAHPGRLNETLHIVFKDADTSWRRARRSIAALLRAELYREGVDGEAVDWACRRLQARPEGRRTLVVVSDGCPMDGATALANDAHYLDQHLLQVVQRREADGGVRMLGLGLGLDLSVFYRRSRALDLDQGPTREALREVVGLLRDGRR